MVPGGCMEETWTSDSDSDSDSVSDDDFDPSANLESAFEEAEAEAEAEPISEAISEAPVDLSKPLVEPLFALPCGFQFPECAICYEQIEMVNVTVTTCGHAYHSSCVFKALERSDTCPMCRHQLVSSISDDESEYESSVDEGEENEAEDQDDDEDDDDDTYPKVNLEQLAAKLTNMGYTTADLLKFFIADLKSSTGENKYTPEFEDKLETDINGLLDGTISLNHRDTRSYAAVAAKSPQQAQQAQQAAM